MATSNASAKKLFIFWCTLGCIICLKSEKITFLQILKFLKFFSSQNPTFVFNAFICVINLRSQKLLKIFLASKCAYLELSSGKNRESGGISVNTPRVNFCISIVSAFKSRLGRLNLKILKNHYYRVKLQQKTLQKNAIQKKLFQKWNTLGCFICIKSEKITFVHIWRFFSPAKYFVTQISRPLVELRKIYAYQNDRERLLLRLKV